MVYLVGEVVRKNTTILNSKEWARESGIVLLRVRVLQLVGQSAEVVMGVQHRNEDTDSWTGAAPSSTATSTGLLSIQVTGVRELVRVNISMSAQSVVGWARVEILEPVWR